MNTSFIVFDLDGTLIDGYDAIGDALAYAMERLGVPALAPEKVRVLVGHGIDKLLEKAVGPERASEGIRLFRERYPAVAVEKTRLLPGVREVVAELDVLGYLMPARFSRMILEANGVARYFREIVGPDGETPTKPDPTMLRRLMAAVASAPGDTLVVGDMEVDSEFARAAGCRVVLVPSGSRTREELLGADCDALLDSLARLPAWIDENAPSLPKES
jgi:phosphoglycolate phosphatase